MSGYSEESKRLAHEVAKRATLNLQRSGKSVTRSAKTGRYVVSPTAARNPRTTAVERKSG